MGKHLCGNLQALTIKKIIAGILIVNAVLFAGCAKSANTNRVNCEGLITDTLGTNDSGRIYMPNAFTPNADGLNDRSIPFVSNIASVEFSIYDENNNVVFITNKLGEGWNTAIGINMYQKFYYKIQAVTTSMHKIGLCGDLHAVNCLPAILPKSSLYFQDQFSDGRFVLPTNERLQACH